LDESTTGRTTQFEANDKNDFTAAAPAPS